MHWSSPGVPGYFAKWKLFNYQKKKKKKVHCSYHWYVLWQVVIHISLKPVSWAN